MTSLKFCAIGILGLVLTAVIKQWKSDWLPLVRLALVLTLGISAIELSAPIVSYLSGLAQISLIAPYATLLLKALSIAWLAQYTAALCRECGEGGTASGVELVARIELLILALPLVGEILETAKQLLSMGGGT